MTDDQDRYLEAADERDLNPPTDASNDSDVDSVLDSDSYPGLIPDRISSARANEIFSDLYEDLRAVAHSYFRRERPGHTLQPTELVDEAYIQFQKRPFGTDLTRAELLAILSLHLRRYLIDYHRKRNTKKRGGGYKRVSLVTDIEGVPFRAIDSLALEEGLAALEKERRGDQLLKGVLFKYVAGLNFEEIGPILGISPSSARDDCSYARVFLAGFLGDDGPSGVRPRPKPRPKGSRRVARVRS